MVSVPTNSSEFATQAPNSFNPVLWNSDVEAIKLLSFFTPGTRELELNPAQKHYIAEASEVEIRKLASQLEGEVLVLKLEQSLASFCIWMGQRTEDAILMQAKPYEEWLDSLSDQPLTKKDAAAIARIEIKEKSAESAIRLDELRERCGMSSFDWNRFIRKLEEEIHSAVNAKSGASREERLNLEIKALLKEHEPIKRLFGVNDIATRYSLSKNDVYQLIREIGRNTQTPECECFSFDELLDQESEGIEYLIPGMLPKGETVLCAGMPKAGKTLLALDAAFAIATGESHFLGEKVEQGKVLLISVDESAQSTKAKLLKRGFRRGDQLEVMTKWNISQLNDLESKLEVLRPELVVIDSLKRITLGREISENSAEFADMIYQLKELTGKYGAACILIHHSNKNGDAVGLERVRGSTAIAGAVWGTWMLDRIPKPDPKNKKRMMIDPADPARVLSVMPRDCQGQNLKVELNPENLSFAVSTESEEDQKAQQEKKTQQQLILSLLVKYAPNGLTGREIIEELNLSRSAYNTLNTMVERRLITQRQSNTDHRSMVYCLKVPPSPSTDEKDMTNFSETPVVDSKTNSHGIVTMTKKISHTPLAEKSAHDECNQEPAIDTEDSHVFTPSEGGGGDEQIEAPVISTSLSKNDDEVNKLETVPSPWESTEEVASTANSEPESDPWLEETTINEIAEDLANEAFCDSPETLAILRGCWDGEAMNAACKRLSPERHAQIKAWVLELNGEKAAFEFVDHAGQTLAVGDTVDHASGNPSLKKGVIQKLLETKRYPAALVLWPGQKKVNEASCKGLKKVVPAPNS